MTRPHRHERLVALVDGCEVYDAHAERCVNGYASCPRYALQTAEPGHEANPNWTVHEDLDSACEQVKSELQEEYPWWPGQLIDLDTGADLIGRVKIEHTVSVEPEVPA